MYQKRDAADYYGRYKLACKTFSCIKNENVQAKKRLKLILTSEIGFTTLISFLNLREELPKLFENPKFNITRHNSFLEWQC